MRVTIQFETANAAFDDPAEVGRIVAQAGQKLPSITFGEVLEEEQFPLMDSNGNKVGFVPVSES